MKKTFIMIMAVLLLAGCSQQWKLGKCRQWNCCPAVKDSSYTSRVDSVWLEKLVIRQELDSASFVAWLECNDSNEVVIMRSEYWQGKYIEISRKMKDGLLKLTASTPNRVDTVEVPREIIKEVSGRDTVTQVQVNILKWWQTALMWTGGVLIILLCIYSIYRLYRFFKSLPFA